MIFTNPDIVADNGFAVECVFGVDVIVNFSDPVVAGIGVWEVTDVTNVALRGIGWE